MINQILARLSPDKERILLPSPSLLPASNFHSPLNYKYLTATQTLQSPLPLYHTTANLSHNNCSNISNNNNRGTSPSNAADSVHLIIAHHCAISLLKQTTPPSLCHCYLFIETNFAIHCRQFHPYIIVSIIHHCCHHFVAAQRGSVHCPESSPQLMQPTLADILMIVNVCNITSKATMQNTL